MIRLVARGATFNTRRGTPPVGFGMFNRATDAGVTWKTPVNILNNVQFGTLDMASSGNLVVRAFEQRAEWQSNASLRPKHLGQSWR